MKIWKRKGVDFAKSERKVLKVLSNFENLTQGEISALAKMPKRTVRFAVLKLKEKRMLAEFLHEDARMSSYALKGAGRNAQGKPEADWAKMPFGALSMRRFI